MRNISCLLALILALLCFLIGCSDKNKNIGADSKPTQTNENNLKQDSSTASSYGGTANPYKEEVNDNKITEDKNGETTLDEKGDNKVENNSDSDTTESDKDIKDDKVQKDLIPVNPDSQDGWSADV